MDEASNQLADATRQEAVSRGLRFLADAQQPSGGFPIEVTWPDARGSEPDSSPFATSIIGHSLGFARPHPLAALMLRRAVASLLGEMEPPGVWRYWCRDHDLHRALPADVDDTACVTILLRQHGVAFPDPHSLLLANRDSEGRFYTWLVPRPRPLTKHVDLWRAGWLQWRHPLAATLFWLRYEARLNDVDAVVNANALLCCGGRTAEGLAGAVGYLCGVVRERREATADKWYRRPLSFHYALSRCAAAGIGGLDKIRDTALARIRECLTATDDLGGPEALDVALGACALLNWQATHTQVEAARSELLGSQQDDGGWPSAALYWGGRSSHAPSWGSRALTTALCVEALVRQSNG